MGYPGKSPHPIQYLYPRCVVARGYPKRYFGENELSLRLIRLSLLPTSHPLGFQPKWVRSSTRSYPRFNLPMARSLRFGSRARDCDALFGLAFATASPHGLTSPRTTNSQAHSSKGTLSPLPRRLQRIVGTRFQVLFHSPPGVLFKIGRAHV